MGTVGNVTVSEFLGFLSLASYVALLGQVFWKTWIKSRDSWGLYDHGFDKMPEVIKWALQHCLDQGFIVVRDRNSKHFIQFRKYIMRNGEYGLELSFPKAPWSKAYSPHLSEAMTADRIPFRETREDHGEVTAFIHVDCGQNIDMAVDLARRCFFDIFGLALDTRFKSSPTSYSILYDHVDDPGYENPPFSQFWPVFRANWQAKGLPDPNLLMRSAAFTVGLVFCYPALWGAWFLAEGAPPDWQWFIGPIHLAGSHETWKLLLIFCALVVGSRRTGRELAQFSRHPPRTQMHRFAGLLFVYALPMAVITSWIEI